MKLINMLKNLHINVIKYILVHKKSSFQDSKSF